MSQARARTRSARSGVERTNHEATKKNGGTKYLKRYRQNLSRIEKRRHHLENMAFFTPAQRFANVRCRKPLCEVRTGASRPSLYFTGLTLLPIMLRLGKIFRLTFLAYFNALNHRHAMIC